MNPADRQVLFLCLAALGILGRVHFLSVLLYRAWVKNDLQGKNRIPLSVRWRPFGWWGGFYGCCFSVRFVDSEGQLSTKHVVGPSDSHREYIGKGTKC